MVNGYGLGKHRWLSPLERDRFDIIGLEPRDWILFRTRIRYGRLFELLRVFTML